VEFSSFSMIEEIGREIAGENYTNGVQSIAQKCLRFALAPAERQASFLGAFFPQAVPRPYNPPTWLVGLSSKAVRNAYDYWAKVKDLLSEDAEIYSPILRINDFEFDLELEETDSDIHERGEFTAMLRVAEGRLLYKPRDSRAEKMLSVILASLFEGDSVFVPRLIDSSGRGYWQEAVSFGSRGVSDATIQSCGILIALCQLIGLTDQHSSNARLAGDRVCLVDGETIFHPLTSDRQKHVVTESGSAPVGLTPIITCMIPAWTVDQSSKRPRLANTLVGDILSLNDQRTGWWRHVSECLITGYDQAMTKIDEIHEEVDTITSTADDILLRRVARPTSGYYHLVERAVANMLMKADNAIHIEIERLLASAEPAYYVENEAATLASGLIPRCVQRVGSDEIGEAIRSNKAELKRLWASNREVVQQSIVSAGFNQQQAARLIADRSHYRLVGI
jgi:hypothetical protein